MAKVYSSCIVLLVLSAAACTQSAELSSETLNCDGVAVGPLSEISSNPEHACNKIKEMTKENKADYGLGAIEKADLINQCLCNIVPRQAFWVSILNSDVRKIAKEVMEVAGFGEAKSHASFWKRLDKNRYDIMDEARRLLQYQNMKVGGKAAKEASMDAFLPVTCTRLYEAMQPLWIYVQGATRLSGNPSLANMVTDYDENLFKLYVAYKTCKWLDMIRI